MFISDFHPYYNNSWALVIGINDYINFNPLTYARNDAESIASILENKLHFESNRIFLLKDKDATREKIFNCFIDFVNKADSPDDRILFFFAGHGTTRVGYHGEVGYLIPVDGDANNLASFIRWDELIKNADLIQAKHILFIFDACFSGLAFRRATNSGAKRFLSEILQRRSRQVITAGKADQTVSDGGGPEGQNSIFTGYLIEGLSGKAMSSNGILTANDLMHYVYEKLANDCNSKQTPHYGHLDGDGDFVITTPQKNLKEIFEHDQIMIYSPEMPEIPIGNINDSPQIVSSFIIQNGYSNPHHPNFGRNDFSNRLGTIIHNNGRVEEKAFSWLGMVIEPLVPPNFSINIFEESKKYKNYSLQGNDPSFQFIPPKTIMTTLNSVILFDNLSYEKENFWSNFLRIEKKGIIEFCDSMSSFLIYEDVRSFSYVQVIGMAWQFLFFAKKILTENGFLGATYFYFNIIGTKDTILSDFSTINGKDNRHWINPGDHGYPFEGPGLFRLKCSDPNIQLKYNIVLENLTEESSKEIIVDIANQIGLAYNHQSEPRCFNYGSNEFPWGLYFRGRQM
ncbi:MAG: caspase domain-containing protein [Anaerolineaceae bacterium]